MSLNKQEIESIESEIWNGYNEQVNLLPRLNDVLNAISQPDNIHFGKKIAHVFALCIEDGYLTNQMFAEYGYDLDIEGKFKFQDGSGFSFDEKSQSMKLFNFE